MGDRTYIAIDLKSFFASVECVERGLDPMATNLVVADGSRTEKTICLAVSPSLKSYGISGRARLFEVVQRVKEINAERRGRLGKKNFTEKSHFKSELENNPELELSYIVATPRMKYYIEYSTKIYNIYLKYIAPEDIHVYSIDEVFMDVTDYLKTYNMTAHELAMTMIRDVLKATKITATAGIGSNLYLCKIAMDIVAKRMPADKDGVRIAELDEMKYRELLWDYRPITDFWRVGRGYAKKLAANGMYTMGDVARCSVGKTKDFHNEELLYKLFGVNAELLIDHAWGYEPCRMNHIKNYKPRENSICSGQVLQDPYDFTKARIVVGEMADALSLDLLSKGLNTDQLVLTVGYDRESLIRPEIVSKYNGPVTKDFYGRLIPKPAHGTINLKLKTSSTKLITDAILELFDRIVNKDLLVRRFNISANKIVNDEAAKPKEEDTQLNFFVDYKKEAEEKAQTEAELAQEKSMQQAILEIKKKFGKNAVLKGMNLEDGATMMERNKQIGGHKA